MIKWQRSGGAVWRLNSWFGITSVVKQLVCCRPNCSVRSMAKLVVAVTTAGALCQEAMPQNRSQAQPSGKQVAKKSVSRRSTLIQQGKELFSENQCLDCHLLGGKGCADGVALDDVGRRRTAKFIEEQLADPERHVARAAREFGGEPNLMTAPNLSKPEIDAIVAYLR